MESPRSERIRRLKHLEQNSDLIIEVDLLNKCTFDNLFIMTEQEILERKKNELTIKKITKPIMRIVPPIMATNVNGVNSPPV